MMKFTKQELGPWDPELVLEAVESVLGPQDDRWYIRSDGQHIEVLGQEVQDQEPSIRAAIEAHVAGGPEVWEEQKLAKDAMPGNFDRLTRAVALLLKDYTNALRDELRLPPITGPQFEADIAARLTGRVIAAAGRAMRDNKP